MKRNTKAHGNDEETPNKELVRYEAALEGEMSSNGKSLSSKHRKTKPAKEKQEKKKSSKKVSVKTTSEKSSSVVAKETPKSLFELIVLQIKNQLEFIRATDTSHQKNPD